jgi:hypothetical protein
LLLTKYISVSYILYHFRHTDVQSAAGSSSDASRTSQLRDQTCSQLLSRCNLPSILRYMHIQSVQYGRGVSLSPPAAQSSARCTVCRPPFRVRFLLHSKVRGGWMGSRWQMESNNVHLKRCAGCECAAYCSAACQKAHWQQHEAHCKRVVKA